MEIVKNDQTVFFDCDGTICLWNYPLGNENEYVWVENFGHKVKLYPHYKHIQLLKQHASQGHIVVLWSAGGWEWAAAVAKAFNLEEYVSFVMNKPLHCYDDLPPTEWIVVDYIEPTP